MEHVTHLWLIFWLILSCTISCQDLKTESATQETIALVNGILIDGSGAEPIKDAVVIIQGDTITAAGTRSEVAIPPNARQIDVQGSSILPGFINAHVHNGFNEQNLKAWAQAGVTTVRDLGASLDGTIDSIRKNLDRDNRNARLVAAGPILTAPGGYPIAIFNSPIGQSLTTFVEIQPKITALLDGGADILKVAVESGTLWNQNIPMLSQKYLSEISTIAHDRGTRVSAHITVAADIEKALDGDVDDLAHMATDHVSDDIIARIIAEDVYWVPTLELWHCVGYGYNSMVIDNLRRFVQAGGKVALGTDYDGYYCDFDLGMPMIEIKGMQAAGMSNLQIIVAATKHAARVCNQGDKLGIIEAGNLADILVADGNPLDDIHVLTNVWLVIHNGRIIRDDHDLD